MYGIVKKCFGWDKNNSEKSEIISNSNAMDIGKLFNIDPGCGSSTNLMILRKGKLILNRDLLSSLITLCSDNHMITSEYIEEVDVLNGTEFKKVRFSQYD